MSDDNLPAVPDDDDAALDTSYEIALDDDPDGTAEPVHDGAALAVLPDEAARLPVIPVHLQTLAGIRSAVAARAADTGHGGAYHAVRSPWYLLLALLWAPVGAFRLLGRLLYYVFVGEQSVLRSQAVADGDSREYRALQGEWRRVHEYRRVLAGIGAFIVLLAAVLIFRYLPPWVGGVIVGVAVPVLARAGRPEDKPIVTPSMTTPRYRLVNADTVLRAYYKAKLGDPVKPDEQVTFGSPMSRDGQGSRVAVDLPAPLGLEDAMKAKPGLASGLDVSLSQIFIHRDPTSYRRHVLWIADRDPLAIPVGRTPLLACKATDIWKPAPLGLDERGQLVSLSMMWQSILVGALPRQGKTFSARLLGLYAALDPYVKLHVFDASGKPDWRKFALVADSCAFGLTPTRDGLPPEILLETLRFIKADVQDRYERLSGMPTTICPYGKLTREIARDPRYDMPVRLLLMDEFQEYFDLGSISKEIAGLIVFITKVAPGAGVILVDATQKPSGIGSGEVGKAFTSARDNHQVRISLRTSSYSVSEAVLGQGAYGEGLDSSTLLPEYKGVGIMRGASDVSPTVRMHLADGDDAEKINLAGRRLRERAGTLSGYAAGIVSGREERDVLHDVAAVFGSDSQLHWGVLAERLAGQFPGRWAGVTADAVSQQCRDLNVRSADVRYPPGRSGVVRKGCYLRDVVDAAARGTAGQEG
jgi:S-DNA-T family DNA segregation ATPase FtsK/SpoIIIE